VITDEENGWFILVGCIFCGNVTQWCCLCVVAFVDNYGQNHIGGVMVRVLVSSVVGLGFEPQLCQAKDYRISICCIFVKHTALRSKRKHW
jgi:hypothetical protein